MILGVLRAVYECCGGKSQRVLEILRLTQFARLARCLQLSSSKGITVETAERRLASQDFDADRA